MPTGDDDPVWYTPTPDMSRTLPSCGRGEASKGGSGPWGRPSFPKVGAPSFKSSSSSSSSSDSSSSMMARSLPWAKVATMRASRRCRGRGVEDRRAARPKDMATSAAATMATGAAPKDACGPARSAAAAAAAEAGARRLPAESAGGSRKVWSISAVVPHESPSTAMQRPVTRTALWRAMLGESVGNGFRPTAREGWAWRPFLGAP
mmetsp:Transcript_41305/g.118060  ORF Transcript_41305/g.118060 Transcript_41305/m.118060 type:complete len:205 (-) Transcript_41305:39-653(-)